MKKVDTIYAVCNRSGRVVAWSEDKKPAKKFVKQRNDDLAVVEVSNKKVIDNVLVDEENLLIVHEELINMYVTALESEVFMTKANEELNRIKDTIRNLTKMRDTYTVSPEEKKSLNKSIKGLEEMLKIDTFSRIMGIKTIQRFIADKDYEKKGRTK